MGERFVESSLLDAMMKYLISTSSVEPVSQIATEVFITIDEAVFYRVILYE